MLTVAQTGHDIKRDVEDLLTERGVEVSYEAIRLWVNKFGPEYAGRLKKKRNGFGDTFFIDVFLQKRRDGKAAKRFFKRLISSNQGNPRKIVTDKLGSYRVAHRELFTTPLSTQITEQSYHISRLE